MSHVKKDIVTKQYASSEGLAARIRFYARYNPGEGGWWKWVFRQIQEQLGSGSKTVLEMGCGRGDLWHKNRDAIQKDWSIRFTDQSAAMGQLIEEIELPCVKTFELLDARQALETSSDVDLIVANHMLYCLTEEERGETLSLAAERLRVRKGVLCASTNGLQHLAELWQALLAFDPSLEAEMGTLRSHLTFQAFSLENGGDQLKKHFTNVEWHEYANTLFIDDADVLADFFCSFGPIVERLREVEREAELRAFLHHKIKQEGPIKTRSISGLFIARP